MGSTLIRKKKVTAKKDFVSWFEIPAITFHQALAFYNYIFDIEMETVATGDHQMAFFQANGGVGGAIVCGPGSIPNENGPLVYLNGGDDLNTILNKVEAAGGRVILPKTSISNDFGFFALFLDTEGNKLALHSKS